MPPPSHCSTRSTNDHANENENGNDNCKSEVSNYIPTESELVPKPTLKGEALGLVKTLLGPSLEDTVLRTLEFGKGLIQKSDGAELASKEKKLLSYCKKELTEGSQKDIDFDLFLEKGDHCSGMKELKNTQKGRAVSKKVSNVSKIRSLDSDLKKDSPSPEKIKRQLEALIQINKDEPPERGIGWNYCSKTSKAPLEMTVMPSFCVYQNEADLNCPSSCDMQSNTSKQGSEGDPGTSNVVAGGRRKTPNKICQAPEFLSNALGPTIDVSIIDNLKLMRDIFKCDSAKGEGPSKPIPQEMKQEVRFQTSEADLCCKIVELRKKIEELEHKERCLTKQIEEEELMRECKRKAFEEEEKRLENLKACVEMGAAEQKTDSCMSNFMEASFEAKYESLQSRIACEEEKLMRLKTQSEAYKREIVEARCKKEALKKNKLLLDAWDVFASRVCHTRLPSFSRVTDLERKHFKADDNSALHCCFPVVSPSPLPSPSPLLETPKQCPPKPCKNHCQSMKSSCLCPKASENKVTQRCGSKHDSRCPNRVPSHHATHTASHHAAHTASHHAAHTASHHAAHTASHHAAHSASHHAAHTGAHAASYVDGHHSSHQGGNWNHEAEDDSHMKCKLKLGEIQFPIQRDIFCGLHQMIKTCACRHKSMKLEGHTCSSEDELINKYKTGQAGDNTACRSKSDTSIKLNRRSKITKVMWATARINVFQDNCRTYEIMDASCTPPPCKPLKTEGIFVVKTPRKLLSSAFSKRKCQPSCSRV